MDNTLSCGSDHYALRWKIDYGEQPIESITGIKYNFKKADIKQWKEALKGEVCANQGPWISLRENKNPTTDMLDAAAEALNHALVAATQQKIPQSKPSKAAKPWWTPGISQLHDLLTFQRQQARLTFSVNPEQSKWWTQRTWASTNKLAREIKKAKWSWIDETVRDVTAKDIWDVNRWTKGIRQYPSPAIQRGDGREPAVQHRDKCQTLRDTLFQPPPPLPGVSMPDLTSAREGDIPFHEVSQSEVRSAIFDAAPQKVPGPNKIPAVALQWAWETVESEVFSLIAGCIRVGHHPEIWHESIAVALRKPGKPDYTLPRAYRLIQLLDCLGKVSEQLQARRLAHFATAMNLVAPTQFGARPGSSMVDAMLTVVHDIDAARDHGLVTSALTFDIKGFFDYVNHTRMLKVLRQKGVPLPMVRWVASFLSERKTAICLDGVMGEMLAVVNGIPQGSPASPILAILYASELNEIFEQPIRPISEDDNMYKTTQMWLKTFVDDGKLIVSSLSLEHNVMKLRMAYNIVENWLTSAGLSPDLVKRELAHYHHRRTNIGNPSIWLPGEHG